jgi:TolB protein
MPFLRSFLPLIVVAIFFAEVPVQSQTAVGMFEAQNDVGTVRHPGSASFDDTTKTYTISGSGENMWASSDAFHFVWKKISAANLSLTADISFVGEGVNPHRKAVLVVRQTLDADSPYADVAVHGSGLTSLQFRDAKGGTTHEIQANISAPQRVRLVKQGDYFFMELAPKGGDPQFAGGSMRLPLTGTFYVGIGVCSHESKVVEKAVFSNMDLSLDAPSSGAPKLYSTLETITIDSTDRHVEYVEPERFEAPNWTRDGAAFIFNRNGRILRLAAGSSTPETIDTGFAIRCNNDHGISPDGKMLVISDQSHQDDKSRVYVLPLTGGTPRRITANAPSYWHGWSPEGSTLAFVGQRNDDFDIYTISTEGGDEKRLTTAKGLDDGPEYSPDGQYIYFNSERTGHMQIWRMKPDGTQQEQVFSDDLNNWFPHISPDGKWMVFLTYDGTVTGHPENKDVTLRLMSLANKQITVLAKLFGGQGTINVPSWSPDSTRLAFVSYQMVTEARN